MSRQCSPFPCCLTCFLFIVSLSKKGPEDVHWVHTNVLIKFFVQRFPSPRSLSCPGDSPHKLGLLTASLSVIWCLPLSLSWVSGQLRRPDQSQVHILGWNPLHRNRRHVMSACLLLMWSAIVGSGARDFVLLAQVIYNVFFTPQIKQ